MLEFPGCSAAVGVDAASRIAASERLGSAVPRCRIRCALDAAKRAKFSMNPPARSSTRTCPSDARASLDLPAFSVACHAIPPSPPRGGLEYRGAAQIPEAAIPPIETAPASLGLSSASSSIKCLSRTREGSAPQGAATSEVALLRPLLRPAQALSKARMRRSKRQSARIGQRCSAASCLSRTRDRDCAARTHTLERRTVAWTKVPRVLAHSRFRRPTKPGRTRVLYSARAHVSVRSRRCLAR